jgi:ATP-dependent DNA helicase RecG
MELEQITRLFQQREGLKIEFKEAKDKVPGSLYSTVAAFSNTDGGTVLLGVADNGVVTGVSEDALGKLQKEVISSLNSRDCINPPLYLQPYTVQHPDGLILVVQVQASSQVHDHAGKIYIREFECDLDITNDQQKTSELYFRKRTFFTEAQIYDHLSTNDLDPALFDKARQLIRNYRSDHPWLLVSNEQLLKDSILWRKDFSAGHEGLTLASALIFGKESTIQSILPAYKVEAMVRRLNKDRWDDRITLRKNLIDTYLELKLFLNRYLPEKFYLENDQRIDLRDKIFREVIGNIIVHREYTSALSTDLVISENEVVTTNPNRPLFHGPIDPVSFNPFPKNPNIRKFFTAFGWTDEIGSGIRNTYRYLPLYANNAKPVFTEDDIFKITIPLLINSLSNYSSDFHAWLGLSEKSFAHFQKGSAMVALPASLLGASWENALLFLVPSWHRKGTQLPCLKWPKNQALKEEKIKKVPSWREKGTQLLKKKGWYLISILSLTAEPVKMSELMEWIGYKNEKTFRDNYIKPLKEAGFITLTIPEQPTNPENKYIITEKGKLFLGGFE